jgi:hypothetical protein
MILRITNVERFKGKKSATRGAVASSPLFRSPAREWSDAEKNIYSGRIFVPGCNLVISKHGLARERSGNDTMNYESRTFKGKKIRQQGGGSL